MPGADRPYTTVAEKVFENIRGDPSRDVCTTVGLLSHARA